MVVKPTPVAAAPAIKKNPWWKAARTLGLILIGLVSLLVLSLVMLFR